MKTQDNLSSRGHWLLSKVRFGHRLQSSPWDNAEPIREELFGAERLEEHGRSLAAAQTVTSKPIRGHALALRLADNAAALLDAYKSMARTVDEGRAITPAADWLIDNYYIIERQVGEIRRSLPPGYYRQLPKLAEGPFAGYPRVLGLAWAFVAHTDSVFDTEMLLRYVRAYQEVQPLSIGELWAVSTTLRIVLIENLRRLARQIVRNRDARQLADAVADRVLGAGDHPAEPVSVVLGAYAGAPLSDAFAVQLLHRLRDQDTSVMPALAWLDQRLAERQATADSVVREVHRRQGASNVTMRNIITSLRQISDVDWQAFFEAASLVDEVLAASGRFREMDFSTRNLYRSAIEELARGSTHTELDIARSAVVAAQRPRQFDLPTDEGRKADPGYYLIAGGRNAFEAELGFHAPFGKWPSRANRALGISGYGIAVAVATAIILSLPLLVLDAAGLAGTGPDLLVALGLVPAIDVAIALVNRTVAFGFGPTPLPALELREGIPPKLRTLVVVPVLLTTKAAITELIERLEVHHLASPDGDLHFALLSDWTDAATEHVDGDDDLLAWAAAGIARLNRQYEPASGGARFLLLHRRRVWNPGESRWIGWERKRGKLRELNRLLRGATDTTFVAIDGVPPLPPADIRFP